MIATKTGWHPVKAVDLFTLGAATGTCDRCHRTDLRFVHTVEHPTEGQLKVGCECAKRLCHGYPAAKEEARLRNLWSRRSKWLTRNWATSWKGNQTLKFDHDGKAIRVTIFPGNCGGWSYCLAVGGMPPSFSPGNTATADEAKLSAFDRLAEVLDW